jgi:hypothetical protein
MPVSREQLLEMRRQLKADRELIGNDDAAKPFLEFQERNIETLEASWAKRNPIDALDHVLSEIENGEIGRDSATGEELHEITAEIREWEAALKTVPAENRGLPLFKIAEKAVSLLKQNCVALADKTDLELRMIAVFESTKHLRAELQEVDRLIRTNSELNLGATAKVFQHFKESLTPALDSVLNKSLGDILTAKQ